MARAKAAAADPRRHPPGWASFSSRSAGAAGQPELKPPRRADAFPDFLAAVLQPAADGGVLPSMSGRHAPQERAGYVPVRPAGDDDADRGLVAAAFDGDATAIRTLCDRLIDTVHAEVARCMVRQAHAARRDPRQDVADLVQEVLVALFDRNSQELRRWDPQRGRSLDSFVRLVARRRVARVLRHRRGNPWAETPVDPAHVEISEASEQVRHLEERGELHALLRALQARMSVRDRVLFDLLYVRELGVDEAAQQLGMTRAAVHAWTYRMRKLARSLAEDHRGDATVLRGGDGGS